MRRVVLLLAVLALVLAGCGGSSGDTTVPDPPKSTAYAKGSNEKVDKLVADWRSTVPAEMKTQGVKDLIEEKIYQSTASLKEIADFYAQLTTKGWVEARRMPGLQAENGFFTTGYEHGNTSLVVAAVDASKLGGSGVVVYTAKGTK